MPNEPKPTSERARKRAAGKILRDLSIKRRETYFDLLVSGYSVEQIASDMKKSPSAVRRAVGQALAKRRLDAPEDYARIQVARLTKALRCADVSLEEGDLKAIAPFVKVVRELNLYHGLNVGAARPAMPAALPEIAPTSPPLALTHSPGVAVTERARGRKKLRKSAVKPLKSFARVNLCARASPASDHIKDRPLEAKLACAIYSSLRPPLPRRLRPRAPVSPMRSTETTCSSSAVSNTITPCVARPGDADARDRHADELAAVGHQHDLVAVLHRERSDERAVAGVDRHGDDAFAAAPGDAIFE